MHKNDEQKKEEKGYKTSLSLLKRWGVCRTFMKTIMTQGSKKNIKKKRKKKKIYYLIFHESFSIENWKARAKLYSNVWRDWDMESFYENNHCAKKKDKDEEKKGEIIADLIFHEFISVLKNESEKRRYKLSVILEEMGV